MNRRNVMTAMVTGTAALAGRVFAQDTANVPVRPNTGAIAEENVKQLLLLMDTDKNGKISKDEWMKFMAAEFDRLDTDHSGELDRSELLKSRMVMRHVSSETQGK
jgi:Ca2+-binding EF-hand superfamily protein